ncbi:MAG: zinc-dependent alcohol dehydrogenase family protein [Flavipsychrobacter sp.]
MDMPAVMHAMVQEEPGERLVYRKLPVPMPLPDQMLVKVIACGVCRTDLHVVDGELENIKYPIIPGHEIIGTVVSPGSNASRFKTGDLVGITWLGYTCGQCKYCQRSQENLCEQAKFTGYTMDGGYAEYTVAYEQFCFPLSRDFYNPARAPLLCAGIIGYRSYGMLPPSAVRIGIYGFGAAAHILAQIAKTQGKEVYAFTRDGDTEAQQFARSMGVTWAGNASAQPPQLLDAAIIFASAGELVPKALSDTDKGGVVVCGGIHMSDIPSFPYSLLWQERILRSVANVTRQDANAFLHIIADIPLTTNVTYFPLNQANKALAALKNGTVYGAIVLLMG